MTQFTSRKNLDREARRELASACIYESRLTSARVVFVDAKGQEGFKSPRRIIFYLK
jgi:hypothetical protein